MVVTFFVMLSAISPYAFTGIEIENNLPKPTTGPGMLPFGIFSTFMVVAAILVLIKKFRNSIGIERQQILFILLGISMMTGAIITTIFIPAILFGSNTFVSYMPVYTAFFLALTAYAIIRHGLFNIRLIATEVFSAAIALIFLIRVLSSNNLNDFVLNLILFIFLTIFGIMLVRGTLREIRELERLSEAKSTFVSIASHQLRSPLTAIKGFISMIKEGSGSEGDRAGWLEKAYISNERLIQLVNDLLNVSRIERGKIKYNFKDADIVNIMDEVVEEFYAAGGFNGTIEFKWKKPEVIVPELRVDAGKLRQVFVNLIDNAIRYTDQGWIGVRIVYLRDLKKVRIVVEDSGIGMSKEDIRGIFELFERGKGGQKASVGGMGIGLYFAKEIIKAHRGRIWAESDGVGKGSKFIVELPIA